MTYKETTEYLFTSAPLFQQQGAGAYKEGLQTTLALDEHFGHPHRRFRTIHVAGTNGKGSCSHTIAAVLQAAGYRVGLYTSPHLVDFRERIRINGEMIPEQYVVDFVANERSFFEPLHPSFFELATAMAFKYFADENVDVAVVEVGLGGRLDCTNIIHPEVSVITNISFDHVGFLGDTLAKIAAEKAGIMKAGVPVIIGEANAETRPVFESTAAAVGAPIIFAEEMDDEPFGHVESSLKGFCQEKNTRTITTALARLLLDQNLKTDDDDALYLEQDCKMPRLLFTLDDVCRGFAEVCQLTGLRGRWEILSESPLTICDTGHNVGGWQYIVPQLTKLSEGKTLRMVFGMVNDKDITTVLKMLPKDAVYYFCNASVKRALAADAIASQAAGFGLVGRSRGSVSEAYEAAKSEATSDDVIFIGGSSFVVADLLTYLQ
ncbi:MAG: folylpolyglutamate synthase/dihydrofolate synthase family protein [Bacteroidales bacterium]|nr:folylpolyglutamate synthase/dihydrofolate synthase family protein [Bacteroidales bacterium]